MLCKHNMDIRATVDIGSKATVLPLDNFKINIKALSSHLKRIPLCKCLNVRHPLPSAYRAPWHGHTPTPQRGKFRDAAAAHCLVTGSYRSVQSKIMESFSPKMKKIYIKKKIL